MLILTLMYIASAVYCDIKVTVSQGTLVGQKTKTNNGFEYYEYLQIPYAKPPVGNLRFKSPQLPESWKGERNARVAEDKYVCLQLDIIKGLRGSEDCLYLSLYAPISATKANKKPVMVFFHGGGYIFGNGILKQENGPNYLIEYDVIVVFINYRLSAFGFLSLHMPELAGNMGLKDQVMALKWIQDNVENFGGDKDKVTIIGISAGAASVEYLMISPLSKGLFNNAIMLSGSVLNHWAINYDIKNLSIALAKELGYKGSAYDNRAIYETIFKENAINILTASVNVSHSQKGLHFDFVPSIEKDFGSGDTFLSEYPYNLLKEGRFHNVSVIKGFCEYEGYAMFVGPNFHDIGGLVVNHKFTDFWAYKLHPTDAVEYNTKFKNVYFDDMNNDKEKSAIDFFGDFDFKSGILTSANLMASKGVNTYVYEFSYDGNMNMLKILFSLNRTGAAHADDTAYIIDVFGLSRSNITRDDNIMIKRMTKMWTDFAKTGNPTPTTSDVLPIAWPAYHVDERKYFVINKNLQVKANYQPEKITIFDSIYAKYHQ